MTIRVVRVVLPVVLGVVVDLDYPMIRVFATTGELVDFVMSVLVLLQRSLSRGSSTI